MRGETEKLGRGSREAGSALGGGNRAKNEFSQTREGINGS
jgi:hypothetical protein